MKRLLALVLALVCLGSCVAIAEEKPQNINDKIQAFLFPWGTSVQEVEEAMKDYEQTNKGEGTQNKEIQDSDGVRTKDVSRAVLEYLAEIDSAPLTISYLFLDDELCRVNCRFVRKVNEEDDIVGAIVLSQQEIDQLIGELKESYPQCGYESFRDYDYFEIELASNWPSDFTEEEKKELSIVRITGSGDTEGQAVNFSTFTLMYSSLFLYDYYCYRF